MIENCNKALYCEIEYIIWNPMKTPMFYIEKYDSIKFI